MVTQIYLNCPLNDISHTSDVEERGEKKKKIFIMTPLKLWLEEGIQILSQNGEFILRSQPFIRILGLYDRISWVDGMDGIGRKKKAGVWDGAWWP